MEWKIVSKEEYDEFIKKYPNKLEQDCSTICDPPLFSYNDFSNGKKWPEIIVAKHYKEDLQIDKAEYYLKND